MRFEYDTLYYLPTSCFDLYGQSFGSCCRDRCGMHECSYDLIPINPCRKCHPPTVMPTKAETSAVNVRPCHDNRYKRSATGYSTYYHDFLLICVEHASREPSRPALASRLTKVVRPPPSRHELLLTLFCGQIYF